MVFSWICISACIVFAAAAIYASYRFLTKTRN